MNKFSILSLALLLLSLVLLFSPSLATPTTPHNTRLLRRLKARYRLLVNQAEHYATANTRAQEAVSRLVAVQEACVGGDPSACEQKPKLLRTAALLRHSARQAAAEEEERAERLRKVERALTLARTYSGYVSTAPRYVKP